MLRRQELESQVLAETTRADQIKGQIAAEKHRMEVTDHYDLSVPADHIVWSVAASAGSSVTEGQTVLDLADCGRRFLVVELPERDFETGQDRRYGIYPPGWQQRMAGGASPASARVGSSLGRPFACGASTSHEWQQHPDRSRHPAPCCNVRTIRTLRYRTTGGSSLQPYGIRPHGPAWQPFGIPGQRKPASETTAVGSRAQ